MFRVTFAGCFSFLCFSVCLFILLLLLIFLLIVIVTPVVIVVVVDDDDVVVVVVVVAVVVHVFVLRGTLCLLWGRGNFGMVLSYQ